MHLTSVEDLVRSHQLHVGLVAGAAAAAVVRAVHAAARRPSADQRSHASVAPPARPQPLTGGGVQATSEAAAPSGDGAAQLLTASNGASGGPPPAPAGGRRLLASTATGLAVATAAAVTYRAATPTGRTVALAVLAAALSGAVWPLGDAARLLQPRSLLRPASAAVWVGVGFVTARAAHLHVAAAVTPVILLVALGSALAPRFEAITGSGSCTCLALLLTAGGIWGCVPDTEPSRATIGLLAAALLGWWPSRTHRPLGAAATAATMAGLGWAVAYGIRGRPAAGFGAAACLGVLVLVPVLSPVLVHLGRRLRGRAVLLAVHACVVVAASRWAGLMSSVSRAGAATAAVLVGGAVVLLAISSTDARPVARSS